MVVGQRVVWVPSEVDGWGRHDEWMNPFTRSVGRPLDPGEMEAYVAWSGDVAQGEVTSVSDGFVTTRLVTDGSTPVTGADEVSYPTGTRMGEYWDRVQESPDFEPGPSTSRAS